jgi:hypothetical protein
MKLALMTAMMLIRATWLIAIVRIGLTFLGYKRVAAFLKDRPVRPTIVSIGRILKCVRWASKVVPYASCLTQSVAAKHLLMCYGHGAEMRVGVAKDPQKGLMAHAWLVKDGEVIFGATKSDLQKYKPLADFG